MWLLKNTFMEVRVDGKPPAWNVKYTNTASKKKTPEEGNKHSLFWLPSISRAAGMKCCFRPDCLPPRPNPNLVTGAVRIAEGTVDAHWSTQMAEKEIWTFKAPREVDTSDEMSAEVEQHEGTESNTASKQNGDYCQALADGVRWSLKADKRVEILLNSLAGGPMRVIVIQPTPRQSLEIKAAVSSKPSTFGGKSPTVAQAEISHYNLYYDLVEPTPPLMSRRIPEKKLEPSQERGRTTRETRCPGSSG